MLDVIENITFSVSKMYICIYNYKKVVLPT